MSSHLDPAFHRPSPSRSGEPSSSHVVLRPRKGKEAQRRTNIGPPESGPYDELIGAQFDRTNLQPTVEEGEGVEIGAIPNDDPGDDDADDGDDEGRDRSSRRRRSNSRRTNRRNRHSESGSRRPRRRSPDRDPPGGPGGDAGPAQYQQRPDPLVRYVAQSAPNAKPLLFEGRKQDHQACHTWLRDMEKQHMLHPESIPELLKVNWSSQWLKHDAEPWYANSLLPEEKVHWGLFKEAFIDRWDNPDWLREAMQKYRSLAQKNCKDYQLDNLNDYIAAFIKAYDEIQEEVSGFDALRQFVDHLKPMTHLSVENYLMMQAENGRHVPLRTAMNVATRFEAVNVRHLGSRSTTSPAAAEINYMNGGEQSGGRGGRGGRGRGGRGRGGGGRGGGGSSTSKCYNCGKPGHPERECRSKYVPGHAPENWTFSEGKGPSSVQNNGSTGN